MPKLFTYVHSSYLNNLFKNNPIRFVQIIANSDHEARIKLDLYPLVFVHKNHSQQGATNGKAQP